VGDSAQGKLANGQGFYDKYLTRFARRINVVHRLEARRGEQLRVRVMEDPNQLVLKQVHA
jgi:5-formyltetrahydrofolate cyclo-ligase